MTLPDPSKQAPEEPQRHSLNEFTPAASRVRRRRARSLGMEIPKNEEGQSELVATLAKRAYPTYELFIYALLCGATLGVGYLLDSWAVLIMGILFAPLMTPWVGMTLAVITGSPKFFFETFGALMISAALVFLGGLLTGFAARVFEPLAFNKAYDHVHLWIADLVVFAIGAILLTISFVRSEDKPFLTSVIISYALYMPLNAAAFGLGAKVEGLWPQGLQIFFMHLAFISLFSLLTLMALRFHASIGGIIATVFAVAVLGVSLLFVMRPGDGSAPEATPIPSPVAVASSTLPIPTSELVIAPVTSPSLQPSPTAIIETSTPTNTQPPSPTWTITFFLPLTETAITEIPAATTTVANTPAAEPTPVYAKINASEGGGANLRKTPNGKFLAVLDNGTIVQVLPDLQDISGVVWAHVIAPKNGLLLEGWVLQSVLATATPAPNWLPSPTAPITPTPTVAPVTETPSVSATP